MGQRGIRVLLARNLRRILSERDLTVRWLADFAGISERHLYAILAGDKAATVDWLEKVAEVLDVSVAELLSDDTRS